MGISQAGRDFHSAANRVTLAIQQELAHARSQRQSIMVENAHVITLLASLVDRIALTMFVSHGNVTK